MNARPLGGWMAGQKGVALITALLVVAMATVAAVAMVERLDLDVRRSANLLHGEQAALYTRAVEDWARHILARDARDSKVDHAGEDWATILPAIAVDGGEVAGSIVDLQGRFNLNNLIVEGKPNEVEVVRFRRLLAALRIDAEITDALLDWLDPDLEPRFPEGAEEDEYLREEPAYRNANDYFATVSELRLVRGVTPEIYLALRPHVAALPRVTTINVNTATAPVLQSLAEGIGAADAEALIRDRGDDGYPTVADFLKHDALAGREVGEQGLSVSSGFFRVNSETHVGRIRSRMYSLIERTGESSVRVAMRSRVED